MSTIKRIFILFLSFMLLCCTGCDQIFPSNTPSAPPDDCAEQSYHLADVKNDLKLLGRTHAEEQGIVCDHTASGIAFEAYIKGSLLLTVEASTNTYFTVYVDGQRLENRYHAKGKTEILIDGWQGADNLTLHTFQIVKQTESSWSTATLISMDFYGKLIGPAQDNDLYIEFIGDSISCGYGNLWAYYSPDPSEASGTPQYEDGTLAYPYLTAEILKADVSVLSCSGIGVDLGGTNPDGNGFRMMDFYKMRTHSRDAQTEYHFADARVPDVVVINLGTNDTGWRSPEASFKAGVKELIQFIRTAYGQRIPIVWIHGMMGDRTSGWVQAAMQELGGESEALYLLQLNGDSAGGNGHPSKNAHKTAAAQLSYYLRSKGLATN